MWTNTHIDQNVCRKVDENARPKDWNEATPDLICEVPTSFKKPILDKLRYIHSLHSKLSWTLSGRCKYPLGAGEKING